MLNETALRAVPFNIVHGSGVTAQKFGLEGEGCQLKIYVEKTMGGGGSWPKFKHDYTENVKNLGWRGRGSAWKIFEKNIGGVGVPNFL